MAFNIQ